MFQHLSETDFAYIAGMIDADGSVGFYPLRQTGGGKWYSSVLRFDNTNREAIDWFNKNIGGYVQSLNQRTSERCKPVYRWIFKGDHLVELFQKVMPYMIIKKERVRLSLNAMILKKMLVRKGIKTPQAVLDLFDKIHQKSKKLNFRGVEVS